VAVLDLMPTHLDMVETLFSEEEGLLYYQEVQEGQQQQTREVVEEEHLLPNKIFKSLAVVVVLVGMPMQLSMVH
jgi:hypothetical protein